MMGLKNTFSSLSGKKVLVVGMGRTGVALTRFLKRIGALVTVTDAEEEDKIRAIEEFKSLDITIETGGHRADTFLSSDLIIVSPGVETRMRLVKEAEENSIEVISDVEFVSRFIEVPIFAITGTNGKSTTTELLTEVLRRAGKKVFMGGNIGTPAAEFFDGDYEVCVLEISSFHLEKIKTFSPHAAVLLNITEDHLYRYSSFDDYARTKFNIFSNQKASDYAIVNAADRVIKKFLPEYALRSKIILFTTEGELKQGLYLKGDSIVYKIDGLEEVYPIDKVKLKGLHNIENMMAVIALSRIAGISRKTIADAITAFNGLPHRSEFVRDVNGVKYYDDSKATNVGAVYKALLSFKKDSSVILIAGGKDKGGDYGVLRDVIKDRVKLLIVIGEAKEKIREALGGAVETVKADTLDSAIAIASKRASRGDTVLLSPACSSFDMFKSFEERGDVFKKLVEAL